MKKYIIFVLVILSFNKGVQAMMDDSSYNAQYNKNDFYNFDSEIMIQYNILRTQPSSNAPFVEIIKPLGGTPTVEIISHNGGWKEVRLHYHFKYNGSKDLNVCKMSIFKGTFTGFRKVAE